jgi:hypothetical protein
MAFSFKDILSHVEKTLIDSIKELKKNKSSIRPETALYLFGLSLSSFFEDAVSDVNLGDKQVQARLLDSFRLGWKDGIADAGKNLPAQQGQQATMDTPVETQAPAQAGGTSVPGGAPAGPDMLGNLPMPGTPGGTVAPPAQQGGEAPDPNNPEEEPPTQLEKPEKKPTTERFSFSTLKKDFLREDKFKGVPLNI